MQTVSCEEDRDSFVCSLLRLSGVNARSCSQVQHFPVYTTGLCKKECPGRWITKSLILCSWKYRETGRGQRPSNDDISNDLVSPSRLHLPIVHSAINQSVDESIDEVRIFMVQSALNSANIWGQNLNK